MFIAVDYCLKQLEMDNSVDIYSTVLHLRKFRKNMVRTLVSSGTNDVLHLFTSHFRRVTGQPIVPQNYCAIICVTRLHLALQYVCLQNYHGNLKTTRLVSMVTKGRYYIIAF